MFVLDCTILIQIMYLLSYFSQVFIALWFYHPAVRMISLPDYIPAFDLDRFSVHELSVCQGKSGV